MYKSSNTGPITKLDKHASQSFMEQVLVHYRCPPVMDQMVQTEDGESWRSGQSNHPEPGVDWSNWAGFNHTAQHSIHCMTHLDTPLQYLCNHGNKDLTHLNTFVYSQPFQEVV
ncbi:hypothetical protein AMECASPLE_017649 [Ameca splendens]|uniref:Uncharacterized protein n=1 Tax=Ameca splendens TaxID=208324 RepID=A0ABV0Y2P4_9TELE